MSTNRRSFSPFHFALLGLLVAMGLQLWRTRERLGEVPQDKEFSAAQDPSEVGEASSAISQEDETTHPESEARTQAYESAPPQRAQKTRGDASDPARWGSPILQGDLRVEGPRLIYQEVYRTSLKYPLMMVQRIWELSDEDPQVKNYLGQNVMVADHLVVRLQTGVDKEAFAKRVAAWGMSIRREMFASGLYLVAFPVDAVDSFQNAQKRLSSLPEVRSVAPDLFGKGF